MANDKPHRHRPPAPEPWTHGTGGDLSKMQKAADVPPADLPEILAGESANPFLRQLRIDQGLLKPESGTQDVAQREPSVPGSDSAT